jgi:diacylglycerol kinase family enzyme
MRRVAVVLNPRSGGLIGREDAAEQVAARLRAAGLEARILGEDAAPDLPGRLDRALAEGADTVIVGGRDGTIRAAAQRLAGTATALGIIPLGTMNMLAKDLGLPLELDAAAETLARGAVRAVDVAEVDGEVFLCNSVLGLPSALGRHRERARGQAGLLARLRLVVASARAMLWHMPLRLAIAVEDGPRRVVYTRALAVANNAYDEGVGQILSRTRLDRGELVLYLAHRFGAWWTVKMLLAMALGAWRRRPELESRAAAAFTIHSRRPALRAMNDGEAVLLRPPLAYRIRPGALKVIVPAVAAVGVAAAPAGEAGLPGLRPAGAAAALETG